MTFLEKAMEIEREKGYTDTTKHQIIESCCPNDFDLEKLEDEPACYCGTDAEECEKCWNREMPNTEAKEDKPFTEKEVYEEVGYNKGLNDAWELAKKLVHFEYEGGFSDKEIQNIFDCDEWQCVFNAFTPQEAIAKLKAYEEAQIEVGDVVKTNALGYGIVTKEDEEHYSILCANGNAVWCEKSRVTKTGKHIDIKSILESIGE